MRENSKRFDWTGIEFLVSVKQINKFEKQNSYAVNVYIYQGDIRPLRISEKREDQVINLLLISSEETKHYCWIKSMSKLLSSEYNKHRHARLFCYRCLFSYQSKGSLDKHL